MLVAVVVPPAVVTLGARRSNTATAEKTLELNWWQDRVKNRFNPLPTVPKVDKQGRPLATYGQFDVAKCATVVIAENLYRISGPPDKHREKVRKRIGPILRRLETELAERAVRVEQARQPMSRSCW